MYPKPIEGETNLTYIMALQAEIANYKDLLEAIENTIVGEYLGKIPDFYMYYESIKERLETKKKRLKQVLDEDMCMLCGNLTLIWYEPRYNGYMGRCDTCNSNWRES